MNAGEFGINKTSILLADDDPDVRSCIKLALEKSGYKVFEARDGAEAVTIYTENKDKIDLLLFDVNMPVKRGTDAYDDIHKIKPGVKVLFMSGNICNLIPEYKIPEKGLHFITKPILPSDLLNKIMEVLLQPASTVVDAQ